MSRKLIYQSMAVILFSVMLLSACAPATTPTSAPTTQPSATSAPVNAPTQPPATATSVNISGKLTVWCWKAA